MVLDTMAITAATAMLLFAHEPVSARWHDSGKVAPPCPQGDTAPSGCRRRVARLTPPQSLRGQQLHRLGIVQGRLRPLMQQPGPAGSGGQVKGHVMLGGQRSGQLERILLAVPLGAAVWCADALAGRVRVELPAERAKHRPHGAEPETADLRLLGSDQAGTGEHCTLACFTSSAFRRPMRWLQVADRPQGLVSARSARCSRHTSRARPSSARAAQNQAMPTRTKTPRKSSGKRSFCDASKAFAEQIHAIFPFIADHVSFSPASRCQSLPAMVNERLTSPNY